MLLRRLAHESLYKMETWCAGLGEGFLVGCSGLETEHLPRTRCSGARGGVSVVGGGGRGREVAWDVGRFPGLGEQVSQKVSAGPSLWRWIHSFWGGFSRLGANPRDGDFSGLFSRARAQGKPLAVGLFLQPNQVWFHARHHRVLQAPPGVISELRVRSEP